MNASVRDESGIAAAAYMEGVDDPPIVTSRMWDSAWRTARHPSRHLTARSHYGSPKDPGDIQSVRDAGFGAPVPSAGPTEPLFD